MAPEIDRFFASYRAAFAAYDPVAENARGASHATVDLLWTVEREGGLPSWRFRTGYELQRLDGAWRIVLCVAYEEDDPSDHHGPA